MIEQPILRVVIIWFAVSVGLCLPTASSRAASEWDEDFGSAPYLLLDARLEQSLIAIDPRGVGYVFHGPNGEVFVGSGGPHARIDLDEPGTTVHGTHLPSRIPVSVPGAASGGTFLQHPDGFVYAFDYLGNEIRQVDPTTLLETGVAFYTPHGILRGVIDPQTGHFVYLTITCWWAGETCEAISFDPADASAVHFASLPGFAVFRGIAFNPDGSRFFALSNDPAPSLLVVRRDEFRGRTGTLDHVVDLHERANGLSFHSSGFALISHGFGDITRYDPASRRFEVLAAGGFPGASSVVGADGCVYVPQRGTRFDDGTVFSEAGGAVQLASLVRICGGFVDAASHFADVDVSFAPARRGSGFGPRSRARAHVWIHGNGRFDARDLDPATLLLDPGGVEARHRGRLRFADADGDGFLDVGARFAGDGVATLEGSLVCVSASVGERILFSCDETSSR